MVDQLGYRALFGVIGPSTNTIVQPEFEAMRPSGVTNHYSRIFTKNATAISNESFLTGVNAVAQNVDQAIDSVITCNPSRLVMGMSAITFFGGAEGAESFRKNTEHRSGVGVSTGALSCIEALKTYSAGKRIGLISPYFPAMNEQVIKFLADHGYEVIRDVALECHSWTSIAEVTSECLIDTLSNKINGPNIDAIIQVGTNMRMSKLAAEAERWLGKPVIAINTATYWHALRQNGITDKIPGFGKLLWEY